MIESPPPDSPHPVPVVDPEPGRRALVSGVLRDTHDVLLGTVATTARDLPEGDFPVVAISLAVNDPVAEARFLARHRATERVVFYGDEEERARWSARISYEPYLPRHRVIVPLGQGRALAEALRHALESARERAALEPVLRRINRETDGLRRFAESTILDALGLQGGIRDAYASVIRGALAGLSTTSSQEEAGRALQSALRRVELLRGPEARDAVARSLGEVLERAARPPAQALRVDLAEPGIVDALPGRLHALAAAAGLDDVTSHTMSVAVRALAERALEEDAPGALELHYSRGGGRVAVSWQVDGASVSGMTFERISPLSAREPRDGP